MREVKTDADKIDEVLDFLRGLDTHHVLNLIFDSLPKDFILEMYEELKESDIL